MDATSLLKEIQSWAQIQMICVPEDDLRFNIVLQFALPYALLLSRNLKRESKRLRIIATWILATRIVEYYWQVAPEFNSQSVNLSLLDFGLPIAIGGIFLAIFAVNLRGMSLLPVNDPKGEETFGHD